MQTTKNGIPCNIKKGLDISKMQKKLEESPYVKYAEFEGFENGCPVTIIVPADTFSYKKLKSQYKLVNYFERVL